MKECQICHQIKPNFRFFRQYYMGGYSLPIGICKRCAEEISYLAVLDKYEEIQKAKKVEVEFELGYIPMTRQDKKGEIKKAELVEISITPATEKMLAKRILDTVWDRVDHCSKDVSKVYIWGGDKSTNKKNEQRN